MDKYNLTNTIHYISNKKLDGLCILMKPIINRFDFEFLYCLKNILAFLHQNNQAPRIAFCFTNTRSKCFSFRINFFHI